MARGTDGARGPSGASEAIAGALQASTTREGAGLARQGRGPPWGTIAASGAYDGLRSRCCWAVVASRAWAGALRRELILLVSGAEEAGGTRVREAVVDGNAHWHCVDFGRRIGEEARVGHPIAWLNECARLARLRVDCGNLGSQRVARGCDGIGNETASVEVSPARL